MPGVLGLRSLYTYLSDSGEEYFVVLDTSIGEAGGFSPAPSDAPGGTYPRGWKMRHVYGEQDDGTRMKLPVTGPDNSLYVNGGTFSCQGFSWTVRGRIGEKRPGAPQA